MKKRPSPTEFVKSNARDDAVHDIQRALQRTQRELAKTRALHSEALVKLDELVSVREFLDYEPTPRRALEKLSKGRKRTHSREATAFVLASDWHVEEVVTKGQTGGMNEMDLKIAEERIDRFFRGIVRLLAMSRHGADVSRLVIALLGDIVNGYLRDENLIGNSLTPPQAIVWVWEHIARGLEYVRDNADLEMIHVACRSGNHGRFMGLSTNRIMWSEKESMSLEYVLYAMLAARFRGDKVLSFDVPTEGIYTDLDVLGFPYRLFHGDNVKYVGGVGGLAVPLNRHILRSNQIRKAYQHCLGHFHSTHWLPAATVNGSLVGYDAYAMALGFDFEPPQQSYFLVRRTRGQDERKSIFLDRD